jgi:hypothetical protein
MTDTQQAFLVVYAVLWAAVTPSFARLRAFKVNDIFGLGPQSRVRAFRRLIAALLVANALPAAVLAILWRYLPPAQGFWGMLAGALAGISPAVFPRVLHAVLASEQSWRWFFTRDEWNLVLRQWDEQWFDLHHDQRPCSENRRANGAVAHATIALVMGVVSMGSAWLVAGIASCSLHG